MTTTIKQKATQRFSLFDTDDDGYIELEDYLGVVDALLESFSEAPESVKARALREAYVQQWNDLLTLADLDGNGRISRDEFAEIIEFGVADNDGAFERLIGPAQQALIPLLDTNGDGIVSLDEAARWLMALGLSEEAATATARRLDLDDDGTLSVDEIVAAERDFYVAEDPEALGNSLLEGA